MTVVGVAQHMMDYISWLRKRRPRCNNDLFGDSWKFQWLVIFPENHNWKFFYQQPNAGSYFALEVLNLYLSHGLSSVGIRLNSKHPFHSLILLLTGHWEGCVWFRFSKGRATRSESRDKKDLACLISNEPTRRTLFQVCKAPGMKRACKGSRYLKRTPFNAPWTTTSTYLSKLRGSDRRMSLFTDKAVSFD